MSNPESEVSLLLKIRADLDELKVARAEFGGFINEISNGNIILKGLGTGIAAGLGAGLGVAITSGLGFLVDTARDAIQEVSNLAIEINRATGATGLSGSAYQVFSTVLREANQDVGVLIPALSNLSKTIGGAGDASGSAERKLAAIGLTFKDLVGLSPEKQLERVAVAISQLSDANERDAASSALLGRSYSTLKPLLESLARDGLGGLTAKVSESSGILNDEYTKALDDAGKHTEEAGKRITIALAPLAVKMKELSASTKGAFANLISDFTMSALERSRKEYEQAKARYGENNPTTREWKALYEKNQESTDAAKPGASSEMRGYIAGYSPADVAARRAIAKQEQAEANAQDTAWREASRKRAKDDFDFQSRLQKDLAKLRGDAAKSDDQLQRQEFTAQQAVLARELAKSESEVALIEADRFKTTAQKEAEIQPLLQKENDLITARIKLLSEEVKDNPDLTPAERQQLQDRIDQLEKELDQINKKQATTAPLSMGAQLSADITKLRDQWGTVSQQIAGFTTNTIGTAVDGVSDSIYGAITRTKTWGQIWIGVGASILQSLIKMGTQILFNSALGLTAQKTQQATAATTGPSIAASYAPAAAATSISSYGSAAVVGAAAAGVAIGLIIAMLAKGGMAGGGLVSGPGTTTSDSIITRLSNREFVLRADAAQAIGYDRLQYMNQTGRVPAYAAGGIVNVSPASSPSSRSGGPSTAPASRSGGTYVVFSEAELHRRQYANGDFEAAVLRVVGKNNYRT